jgi:hypothetical protein
MRRTRTQLKQQMPDRVRRRSWRLSTEEDDEGIEDWMSLSEHGKGETHGKENKEEASHLEELGLGRQERNATVQEGDRQKRPWRKGRQGQKQEAGNRDWPFQGPQKGQESPQEKEVKGATCNHCAVTRHSGRFDVPCNVAPGLQAHGLKLQGRSQAKHGRIVKRLAGHCTGRAGGTSARMDDVLNIGL